MTLANLVKHLLGRYATQVIEGISENHESNAVLVISDKANNWNKFALLMSIEGEKLPSQRRSIDFTIQTTPKHRASRQASLTTSQWNELALRRE